jgi:hypothetical protein
MFYISDKTLRYVINAASAIPLGSSQMNSLIEMAKCARVNSVRAKWMSTKEDGFPCVVLGKYLVRNGRFVYLCELAERGLLVGVGLDEKEVSFDKNDQFEYFHIFDLDDNE